MPQAKNYLHPGGWPRARWCRSRFWHEFFSRTNDLWQVLKGAHSLHRAWQRGYDQHAQDESMWRARGGR